MLGDSNKDLKDLNDLYKSYKDIKFTTTDKASRDKNNSIINKVEEVKHLNIFKNIGHNTIKLKVGKKVTKFKEDFNNLSPKEMINFMKNNNGR